MDVPGERFAVGSSFRSDYLNWRRFVIAAVSFVGLRFPCKKEQDFCLGFHRKMVWKPNTVRHRRLLEFEVCARFDFSKKTFDRNRSYDCGFDLYPLESLFV